MENKTQEQIHQVCSYILANATQVDSPEVLTAARELLKTVIETKDGSEGTATGERADV